MTSDYDNQSQPRQRIRFTAVFLLNKFFPPTWQETLLAVIAIYSIFNIKLISDDHSVLTVISYGVPSRQSTLKIVSSFY